MIADAGLIIVMDADQARQIERASRRASGRVIVAGDLDPLNRDGRTIHDPWQQPLEAFESAYARLERCAAVLANELATHVAPAQQPHRAVASNG
jgi:protein-tyrosine-phosphatase